MMDYPAGRSAGLLRVDQVVMEFSLRGGIEAVAFELQRAFRDMDFDCRVITSITDGPAPDVQHIAPFLSRIGTRGRWRYVGRALAVPLFTLAATWFLAVTRRRDGRQDGHRLVLSHGDTLIGDVCVVHAVNRANLDTKRAAGGWRWRLNPMHHWVSLRDRIMIGGLRFRRYVAPSERVAGELRHYYGVPRRRITVIPDGVNLERFSPDPDDRSATRHEFGISADAFVLLFVGHEFERKGLGHVIDALAMPGLGGARLVVVGSDMCGPFEAQAQRNGVAGRVLYIGARNDLPRLYRAADAFVFPTAYESFALVCMEAMACGLPLFATPVGGIEDYLQDGVNGRFIRRDGADIASALAPLVADPNLRKHLRDGALATSRDYAWARIAERYRNLFDEIRSEIAQAPRRYRADAIDA